MPTTAASNDAGPTDSLTRRLLRSPHEARRDDTDHPLSLSPHPRPRPAKEKKEKAHFFIFREKRKEKASPGPGRRGGGHEICSEREPAKRDSVLTAFAAAAAISIPSLSPSTPSASMAPGLYTDIGKKTRGTAPPAPPGLTSPFTLVSSRHGCCSPLVLDLAEVTFVVDGPRRCRRRRSALQGLRDAPQVHPHHLHPRGRREYPPLPLSLSPTRIRHPPFLVWRDLYSRVGVNF